MKNKKFEFFCALILLFNSTVSFAQDGPPSEVPLSETTNSSSEKDRTSSTPVPARDPSNNTDTGNPFPPSGDTTPLGGSRAATGSPLKGWQANCSLFQDADVQKAVSDQAALLATLNSADQQNSACKAQVTSFSSTTGQLASTLRERGEQSQTRGTIESKLLQTQAKIDSLEAQLNNKELAKAEATKLQDDLKQESKNKVGLEASLKSQTDSQEVAAQRSQAQVIDQAEKLAQATTSLINACPNSPQTAAAVSQAALNLVSVIGGVFGAVIQVIDTILSVIRGVMAANEKNRIDNLKKGIASGTYPGEVLCAVGSLSKNYCDLTNRRQVYQYLLDHQMTCDPRLSSLADLLSVMVNLEQVKSGDRFYSPTEFRQISDQLSTMEVTAKSSLNAFEQNPDLLGTGPTKALIADFTNGLKAVSKFKQDLNDAQQKPANTLDERNQIMNTVLSATNVKAVRNFLGLYSSLLNEFHTNEAKSGNANYLNQNRNVADQIYQFTVSSQLRDMTTMTERLDSLNSQIAKVGQQAATKRTIATIDNGLNISRNNLQGFSAVLKEVQPSLISQIRKISKSALPFDKANKTRLCAASLSLYPEGVPSDIQGPDACGNEKYENSDYASLAALPWDKRACLAMDRELLNIQ